MTQAPTPPSRNREPQPYLRGPPSPLTPRNSRPSPGEGSDWVGERDSDCMELVDEFLGAKGLDKLPASIVHQGEEEEDFWEYFVNG